MGGPGIGFVSGVMARRKANIEEHKSIAPYWRSIGTMSEAGTAPDNIDEDFAASLSEAFECSSLWDVGGVNVCGSRDSGEKSRMSDGGSSRRACARNATWMGIMLACGKCVAFVGLWNRGTGENRTSACVLHLQPADTINYSQLIRCCWILIWDPDSEEAIFRVSTCR
ncbi:hypothetical protein TWF696_008561 [Orbilia brochopaga]|uniref:Uncharacterized protein n=1 Tax=Orbilia brochopaga TaxID=3140254 RepID=A0AAV9UGB1_9PEZI